MINEPGRNPCSSTSMHQSTGRRIILRLVRDFLGAAKRLNHVEIVGAELALRWTPNLRQVAKRESCFYKRLRNRSIQ